MTLGESSVPEPRAVDFQWGIKIPLRDGVQLNATLYAPAQSTDPSPVIFTLTPYVGQTYHDYAMYFASRGYRFLTIDVRGRGNSEGSFKPNVNEAADGYDIVEWLAKQPYCNGKVTMWGGSYAGYDQWATAKQAPRHLATIVPAASPFMGVDFPIRNNVAYSYLVQWLTYVAGRSLQDKIFGDHAFWRAKFKQWFVSGAPFRQLDSIVGHASPTFQEWLDHPMRDAYWDGYNPSPEQYARLAIPVLTITSRIRISARLSTMSGSTVGSCGSPSTGSGRATASR